MIKKNVKFGAHEKIVYEKLNACKINMENVTPK